jgi:hypothetical protein
VGGDVGGGMGGGVGGGGGGGGADRKGEAAGVRAKATGGMGVGWRRWRGWRGVGAGAPRRCNPKNCFL